MAWMGRTSRSRRPCARGDVLCAEPGRSHPCPDLCARPAREGDKRENGAADRRRGRHAPSEGYAEGFWQEGRSTRRSHVLSILYLNEVDKMLERAREVTRNGKYTCIEYARFADDLVILIDA